jgi:hypothetical protein
LLSDTALERALRTGSQVEPLRAVAVFRRFALPWPDFILRLSKSVLQYEALSPQVLSPGTIEEISLKFGIEVLH